MNMLRARDLNSGAPGSTTRGFGWSQRAFCTVTVAMTLFASATSSNAEFLMAWGWNARKQIGDGTTTDRFAPIPLFGMSGDLNIVAAGYDFTAVVRNGSYYAWGRNLWGQCAIGSFESIVDVTQAANFPNVSQLSLGLQHSLAIADGGVLGWGINNNYQLWDGTRTNRAEPVPVAGLESGVTKVAAGRFTSLAIKDGAVWSWGGSSTAAPAAVAGLESGVTSIAQGAYHSAVLQNGAVKAWGENTWGQMGGSSAIVSTPTTIAGLESGVTALSVGIYHTLALKNGMVYHYGVEYFNGSAFIRHGPVLATAGLDIVEIAAGEVCSFVLTGDGSFYTWGENTYGRLGIGASIPYVDPDVSIRRVLPPLGFVYTHIEIGSTGRHALATVDYKTLAGDVNLDSVVDFDDLLPLAQNYGTTTGATWAQGDFDLNGTVDFTDLLTLAQNYSSSAPITAAFTPVFAGDWAQALSLVPEPAALGLLGLGFAVVPRARRGSTLVGTHPADR